MIDSKTRRPLVLISVISAMFMIALEATIVSTAMPKVVGDLGGLQLYSWVFSAFLLTQTATTVVFGKMSDVIGRKRVVLAGIGVFLVGSILCGFAWSMPSMILFRLIQGVGAGAIMPMGMTIVGDLYSAQERGKIQGYLASVWAISSVLGPLAGGLIVQHAYWGWIFWINIPIGLAAAFGFVTQLHEKIDHVERKLDHLTAGLFTIAIAAVMALLTAVSSASSRDVALLVIATAVAVGVFVWRERRSPEPMISMKLWGRRPIAAANAASLLGGMIMIGLTTFVPVYVQGVMGRTALEAGFALSAMVLGWPLGATIASKLYVRFGLRPILLTGACLIPVGAAVYVFLSPASSPWMAGIGSWIVGFGMGLLSSSSLVMIQEIVDWSERGSATSSFMFARSLGSTFGATVFGAVLNYGLAHSGSKIVATSDQLRDLLAGVSADPALAATLRGALEGSLHTTFISMFAIALLVTAAGLAAPRISIGRKAAPAAMETAAAE